MSTGDPCAGRIAVTTSTDRVSDLVPDRVRFRLLVAISREDAPGRSADVVVDVRDALDTLPPIQHETSVSICKTTRRR